MSKERLKALQDFIFVSKYARLEGGRKETWSEAVDRVMSMHQSFLINRYKLTPEKWTELAPYFKEARDAYLDQRAIGAQRGLQWGGEQLLKHNMRAYNCTSSYANRPEFFHELMYILLCGAGSGYSVQKHHVKMMPEVQGINRTERNHIQVQDSIEGWADAIKELVYAHFYNQAEPTFDYSLIRPKGAFISGGFKAPGPEPLRIAVEKIDKILSAAKGRKLSPLNVHRIACLVADAVVSGGVRRSALIALFSADDEEMIGCKTGDWMSRFPELARSNNSVVITPDTPKELYDRVFGYAKQFGEPGIAFLKSTEYTYNPCFEVGMFPVLETETVDGKGRDDMFGWSTCNLSEINGKHVTTLKEFLRAGRAAAILGTFQAAYTDFPYLGEVTQDIIRRDALIGVGITGMCEHPDVVFNEDYQREVAREVKTVNAEVAKILGINAAARTTVVKPSGNSSQMLGTSSGIHPFHAKRYIRNVQVNKEEFAGKIYKDINPRAVTDSVWNPTRDWAISFPVEVTEGALLKRDLSAIDFLEKVSLTQNNWIEEGTNWDHPSTKRNPSLRHNVSNTISVKKNEWEDVKDYLWDFSDSFCGISMLPSSGDIDYPQAPYTEVYNEIELAEMYGPAVIMASGLIVDGIHAFGDLWSGITAALNRDQIIEVSEDDLAEIVKVNTRLNEKMEMVFEFRANGVMLTDVNAVIAHQSEVVAQKLDWIRRFKRFARRYVQNDLDKTGRCLKHVNVFHQWEQIKNSKTVDWEEVDWIEDLQEAGAQVGAACAGGKCEL